MVKPPKTLPKKTLPACPTCGQTHTPLEPRELPELHIYRRYCPCCQTMHDLPAPR
jgi:hypothetical protein